MSPEQIKLVSEFYAGKKTVSFAGNQVKLEKLLNTGSAILPSIQTKEGQDLLNSIAANQATLSEEQAVQFLGRLNLEYVFMQADYVAKIIPTGGVAKAIGDIRTSMDLIYRLGGSSVPNKTKFEPKPKLDLKLLELVEYLKRNAFEQSNGQYSSAKINACQPLLSEFSAKLAKIIESET